MLASLFRIGGVHYSNIDLVALFAPLALAPHIAADDVLVIGRQGEVLSYLLLVEDLRIMR